MKFVHQAYVGSSSLKQDICFNKLIHPVAIAPPTVNSPIWLDGIYLKGLSVPALFLPRFAKSGTIGRHLDHKQDHCPTNEPKHFPCGPTGHIFCHDSLDNRVNFPEC